MKKVVMKKAMKRVSVFARGKLAKSVVFRGRKAKTGGGLTKESLLKNKRGRIVSKAVSARSKKNFASSALKKWCDAAKQARKELKLTGFVPVGGKSAQGKTLYARAKAILDKKW